MEFVGDRYWCCSCCGDIHCHCNSYKKEAGRFTSFAFAAADDEDEDTITLPIKKAQRPIESYFQGGVAEEAEESNDERTMAIDPTALSMAVSLGDIDPPKQVGLRHQVTIPDYDFFVWALERSAQELLKEIKREIDLFNEYLDEQDGMVQSQDIVEPLKKIEKKLEGYYPHFESLDNKNGEYKKEVKRCRTFMERVYLIFNPPRSTLP